MFGINNQAIGAAAGVAAMDKLKVDPALMNQLVSAAVTALVQTIIKELPGAIVGWEDAIAEARAKHAAGK